MSVCTSKLIGKEKQTFDSLSKAIGENKANAIYGIYNSNTSLTRQERRRLGRDPQSSTDITNNQHALNDATFKLFKFSDNKTIHTILYDENLELRTGRVGFNDALELVIENLINNGASNEEVNALKKFKSLTINVSNEMKQKAIDHSISEFKKINTSAINVLSDIVELNKRYTKEEARDLLSGILNNDNGFSWD